jgi:drug/metabolite transporter (DMT)-like permease
VLPAILALLSSATFGAADFLGGLATRRGSMVAVVVMSQAAGLLLVFAVLPFLPPAAATARDAAWGAGAGLAGGAGVGLLYYGLATAPMAIVAPVTAVCAVVVPVVAGVASGETLSGRTLAGIALAAVAIVLVGRGGSDTASAGRPHGGALRAVRIALPTGFVIGLFLVALQRTPPSAGLWPLVTARVVSISLFCAGAAIVRQSLAMPRPAAVTAIAGGSLDMIANVLYLVAVRQGQLSVIATLASLYPASTVLLARFVLRERLTLLQIIGIAGALMAIVLIVTGSVR